MLYPPLWGGLVLNFESVAFASFEKFTAIISLNIASIGTVLEWWIHTCEAFSLCFMSSDLSYTFSHSSFISYWFMLNIFRWLIFKSLVSFLFLLNSFLRLLYFSVLEFLFSVLVFFFFSTSSHFLIDPSSLLIFKNLSCLETS